MPNKFDRNLIPSEPDFSIETPLWQLGIKRIAGIDEAGRGAFAGPVSAAAVIFPNAPNLFDELTGIRDSKQMTPGSRQQWASRIKEFCLAWGVGLASAQEIDCLGIVPATRLAVQRALDQLIYPPEHLLVDYLHLTDCPIHQTTLVKGDQRSKSIAAASILAKTTRDTIMMQLDLDYPGYHFADHKGYGTRVHRVSLEKLGPSPVHRLTFQFQH